MWQEIGLLAGTYWLKT